MSDELMLYFGGAVKALDNNGRVGGYLVRFTDAKHKDLTGEYFTEKSYLGPSDGNGAECIFEHGYPVIPEDADSDTIKAMQELADRTFSAVKTKRDKVGIWAETVLKLADDYEKAVFGAVKAGKLGWSSGAPGHRVRKNADGQIVRWPIAEASLTPRPAEPQNRAMEMKFFVETIKSLEPAIKAEWTAAYVNDLPDSSFAVVQSGGEKDEGGKTVPRSLRKLPYKDADGNIDEAHLRNALSRLPQSDLSEADRAKAAKKLAAAAKEAGIGEAANEEKMGGKKPKKALGHRLSEFIDDLVEDGRDRETVVMQLASRALMTPDEVESVLAGRMQPSKSRLKAFADVLGIGYDVILAVAKHSEPRTIKGMFEDELADKTPSQWELSNVYCCVIRKIANAAAGMVAAGTEFDYAGMIDDATNEYAARLSALATAQVEDFLSEGGDEEFYLRSIVKLTEDDFRAAQPLLFAEHLSMVDTAVKGLIARCEANAVSATKAGRMLSERNMGLISGAVDDMETAITDACRRLRDLLESAKPAASDEQKFAALAQLAAFEVEMEELGIH